MTRPEEQDQEVSQLLAQLREEPSADDDFAARLHRRLVEAGPPRPVGPWPRLSTWLGDRPWVTGTLCGSTAGVAAFLLMSALGGTPGEAAPAAVAPQQLSQPSLAAVDTPECEPAAAEAHAEVFVVPAGQVAVVQLNFAVEREVDEAEFSILLPEGLAFFSEGEALSERSFHWAAPLDAGDNEVPVAIVGQKAGVHRVTATATIDGEVVVHEVVLEVREAV